MEPVAGLEPAAHCLQGSCSTTELNRHNLHRGGGVILFFFRFANYFSILFTIFANLDFLLAAVFL